MKNFFEVAQSALELTKKKKFPKFFIDFSKPKIEKIFEKFFFLPKFSFLKTGLRIALGRLVKAVEQNFGFSKGFAAKIRKQILYSLN